MARILCAEYPDLVEDMCSARPINIDTPEPQNFQASKTCGNEMLYAAFHKHSGKNTSFVRALRGALSSIGGVLANKKDSLSTLKAFMIDLVRVGKKMLVRLDWDEAVRPLMNYLRDQSSSIYLEIIQQYGHPTETQRYDALLVLEEIWKFPLSTFFL